MVGLEILELSLSSQLLPQQDRAPGGRGHSALPSPSPKGAGPRMGVARCSPAPPHPMRGLRPRPKSKRVRSGSSQAILAPGGGHGLRSCEVRGLQQLGCLWAFQLLPQTLHSPRTGPLGPPPRAPPSPRAGRPALRSDMSRGPGGGST